eukprot:scaffold3676_cov152-Pinguiococcus_pyrenoidosus.AAC.5
MPRGDALVAGRAPQDDERNVLGQLDRLVQRQWNVTRDHHLPNHVVCRQHFLLRFGGDVVKVRHKARYDVLRVWRKALRETKLHDGHLALCNEFGMAQPELPEQTLLRIASLSPARLPLTNSRASGKAARLS